jgi:hypothetical protein
MLFFLDTTLHPALLVLRGVEKNSEEKDVPLIATINAALH